MRYWLSRFSFSFLILALLLAYTAYRDAGEGANRRHVALRYIGAAAIASLGLAGLRERHRR